MTDGTRPTTSRVPLPLELNYVTKELKVRAQTELFEDEDTVAHSLKLLRSLLKEEEDLLWQDDDLFLLAFLRARKFDVKKAHDLVKGFYATFGKHGHLFYGMDFERLRRILEINALTFLPYRDSEGAVIVACRFTDWDPALISSEENMLLLTFGFLQALRSPSTQIAGFHFIQDFKDLTFSHMMSVKPSTLKFFTEIIQKTVPGRMRGFHAVNENYLFTHLWPLIKQFLPRKIRERIHLHGSDMKSLHKFFHPSILPADLGGELPPFDNSDWRQRMEASADYIEKVRSFGYKKYLRKDWKRKK